jgi:hypothetical protein
MKPCVLLNELKNATHLIECSTSWIQILMVTGISQTAGIFVGTILSELLSLHNFL